MPVRLASIGSKWRVVDVATGRPTTKGGKPVDGGGHGDRARALAQVQAINMSLERAKGNKSIPPRRRM